MSTINTALLCAGLLHFCQIPALFLPSPISAEARHAPPLLRLVLAVVFGGIVISVLGIGLIVVLNVEQLTTTTLGRTLVVWCLVFWTFRLSCQLTLLRRVWPPTAKFSYNAHTVLYSTKSTLYAVVLVASLL